MWVNRRGKYPYVDKQTWITRYWLWRRVVTQHPAAVAGHPRRVAAVLASFQGRIDGLPTECVKDLNEWLREADALYNAHLYAEIARGRETSSQ